MGEWSVERSLGSIWYLPGTRLDAIHFSSLVSLIRKWKVNLSLLPLNLRAKTQSNSYLKLPPNRKTSNQYFGGSTLTFLTHSHKIYRTSLMQTNSFAKALGWNPTHSLQWHVRPLDVNKTEFCLLSFVHSSMASTSNSLTDSSFDVTVSSINRWNSNKTWRGPTLQTSFPKFSGLGWYWRDACREASNKWRSKQDLAAASHLHHS